MIILSKIIFKKLLYLVTSIALFVIVCSIEHIDECIYKAYYINIKRFL